MAKAKTQPAPVRAPAAIGARGEVPVKIGKTDIVIAATMAGLAALSTRLQCRSFNELFARLSGAELAAAYAAIELLTIKGDWQAALTQFSLRDVPAFTDAANEALAHHFEDDAGNAGAAGTAAA